MKNIPSSFRFVPLIMALCFSLAFFHLWGTCNCTPPVGCAEQPAGMCATPPGNTYLLRYNVIGVQGAMTFIGNTLGLSKASCENEPGTSDGIGAFTTVDAADVVGTYPSLSTGVGSPAGTTLTWEDNSSAAVYSNFPAGATILHAELIWGAATDFIAKESAVLR